MIIGIADDANGGSKILVGSRVNQPFTALHPRCQRQVPSATPGSTAFSCIAYCVFCNARCNSMYLYSIQYVTHPVMEWTVDSKSGNAPFRARIPIICTKRGSPQYHRSAGWAPPPAKSWGMSVSRTQVRASLPVPATSDQHVKIEMLRWATDGCTTHPTPHSGNSAPDKVPGSGCSNLRQLAAPGFDDGSFLPAARRPRLCGSPVRLRFVASTACCASGAARIWRGAQISGISGTNQRPKAGD